MKVKIVLKSGVVVYFEADSIEKESDRTTSQLFRIGWDSTDDPNAPRLLYVRLDSVDAIVTSDRGPAGDGEEPADA